MQVNTAKLPYTQSNLWMHASVERKLLADWLLEPGVGPLEWQLPEPVAPTVAGVDVSPSLILLVPYSSPITEQEEIHVEVGYMWPPATTPVTTHKTIKKRNNYQP